MTDALILDRDGDGWMDISKCQDPQQGIADQIDERLRHCSKVVLYLGLLTLQQGIVQVVGDRTTYLPTYSPTYLPTYLLTYPPTHLPTYILTYLHTRRIV